MEEKTKEEKNLECMGGWAFLMLGFAITALIPVSVCMAIYGFDSTAGAVQIGVAFAFAFGLALLVLGVLISIVWCRRAKYGACAGGGKSDENESDAEKATGTTSATKCNTNSEPNPHHEKDSTKPTPAEMYSMAPPSGDDTSTASNRSDDIQSAAANEDRLRYLNPAMLD